MVSIPVDLQDPDIEYKYHPQEHVHEETFGEGVHKVELEYSFTVPADKQRKIKITAVVLGVD